MNASIVIASDHAGFSLKQTIKTFLMEQGYELVDLGCNSETDKVDYPNIAEALAQKMKSNSIPQGILTCGSGVGVSIAANRHPWIRAVHAHDAHLASLSRAHNDSNVLCLGGRFVAPHYGLEIVKAWLEASFEGDRHQRRVDQLTALTPPTELLPSNH